MNTPLETPRLLLRPLVETDAEGLHLCYGDPETMRFWDRPPARDVIETATRLGRSLGAGVFFHACWAMVRREDGQFVGMVNYHHREPWNRRLELGWIMARPCWRQGYMTEALSAVIGHCFAAMDVHRIEATIDPENVASRAVAERVGFRLEGGPMQDRLLVAGAFRSAMMYALLKPDWDEARAT